MVNMKLDTPFVPDINSAIPDLPVFHARLTMVSHEIYCTLEEMRHTPCTKQEDFEKLVDIYNHINELSNKMIKDALNEMKGD